MSVAEMRPEGKLSSVLAARELLLPPCSSKASVTFL